MKKKLSVFIVLSLFLLSACAGPAPVSDKDIPGSDDDTGISNPAGNTDTPSGDPDAPADDGEDSSVSVPRLWLDNEALWADTENMPSSGVSGVYGTGYFLFDIDLDGEKEMVVQYGGGTMHNCLSAFYEMENGTAVVSPFAENLAEGELSLSVYDLSLYTSDDDSFYVNHQSLRINAVTYHENWVKISVDDAGHASFETLFSKMTVYQHDGPVANEYYIGGEEAGEIEFTSAFDDYLGAYDNIPVESLFISSADWVGYSESEKLAALTASFEA